jgi:hypothetical protein
MQPFQQEQGDQADLLRRAGGRGPFSIGCDFENGVVTRFLSTWAEPAENSA